MKSWANGLSVQFFNVTRANGLAVTGKSIGKTLSNQFFGGNSTTIRGTMDKNWPVMSRAVRKGNVEPTTAGGAFRPCARKASCTTEPYG